MRFSAPQFEKNSFHASYLVSEKFMIDLSARDYYRLPRMARVGVQVLTVIVFVWLFESGWINLWNKRAVANYMPGRPALEWGGSSIWSVLAGFFVGYVISLGLIWEVEAIVQRRRTKRKLGGDRKV